MEVLTSSEERWREDLGGEEGGRKETGEDEIWRESRQSPLEQPAPTLLGPTVAVYDLASHSPHHSCSSR